jgi:hypothetical protein
LVFNYTVVSPDTSSDLTYTDTSSLTLAGGTIKDTAGNNATLSLATIGAAGSLSANQQIVIDTTAPVAASSLVDGSWLNSTTQSPTITFTDGTDVGGSGILKHQIQVVLGSNTATVLKTWADFTSGAAVTGINPALSDSTQYKVQIKAIDNAGNETIATSDGWTVDVTGPSAPTGLSLGAVPTGDVTTPTLSWSGAATDTGGSGVASYQVQIYKTSDNSVTAGCGTWPTLTSGSTLTCSAATLVAGTQYYMKVRAVDNAGNTGTESAASANWTALASDACLAASPTPGTVCTGGAIYLGSLSPGATSGTGTDKYMTTPGGCGEIPAGQIVGSGASAYPNADFTPTCSGTDALTKYWNDGTTNYYDIPGLTNYTTTTGVGNGASNTDVNYGGPTTGNTPTIVAITAAGQGGYHAAARYCDKLSYGGYTDWYLPNRYELNLMNTNKASIPGLDVTGNWYWSSTEYATNTAWIQRFSDGYQSTDYKVNANRFRCLRRYN